MMKIRTLGFSFRLSLQRRGGEGGGGESEEWRRRRRRRTSYFQWESLRCLVSLIISKTKKFPWHR